MSVIHPAVKAIVPERLRPFVRDVYRRVMRFGLSKFCPVCSSPVASFLAHGYPPEPQMLCPVCFSKPPHRFAKMYFDAHPELFVEGGQFIHIAPEPGLQKIIRRLAARSRMRYRPGDIRGSGEEFLDIRDMPLPDGSVHLFFACHVINMVQEDRVALREVARVLSGDGVALLQVPAYCPHPTTLEPENEQERARLFGETGVKRWYTESDYIQRLEEAGFIVETQRASDFPVRTVRRYELKTEVIYTCRKR